MYDEHIKLRFITETKSGKTWSMRLFKISEPYEIRLNKDMASMNQDEIHMILSGVQSINSTTNSNFISVIRRYIQWCDLNHIFVQTEAMMPIQPKQVNLTSARHMVGSPEELSEILNNVFKDNVKSIAYLWFAFMGIREEDICVITPCNIDITNKVIRLAGNLYSMPETSMEYMMKLSVVKSHIPVMASFNGNVNLPSIRVAIAQAFTECRRSHIVNSALSYKRVYMSGLFYRIYLEELAGREFDFDSLAESDITRGDYHMSANHSYTKIKYTIITNYKHDYERWKTAFHNE